MDIKSAQQDVRTAYLRGSVAQAIMGMFWLGSAALGTWVSVYFAILMMVLAIALTFPLTLVTLHILGRPMGLPGSHPMNQLIFQIALIIPLSLFLIAPISLYNLNWFFPALMFVMGTHYILFIFLYGMWEFGVLAIILLIGGIAIGVIFPDAFPPGGWFTGIVLMLFALLVQRPLHFTQQ
ncbi:MAG TPA: hypothetical protein VGK56_18970 [Anaerolineales bacterium]